ncbi:hypothetical protein [Paenarthrobacter aurescens]|uniref:hypothetical protein n=1 Tax=Paenarthrobacter aurescens TaxID=43663 RepID=UPI0021C0461C|nr:hypothetical protein [Paenarthrobacter aurescens]MCT9871987.1 hypothetical protein [Paenarthrobacter aurescens]
MKKIHGKSANGYWLMLAGWYGLTIGLATMTPMPWLLVVGGIFIVFPLVVGLLYGQIGRKVQHKPGPDSPAIGIVATVFAVVATLLHGSSIVGWAGPVLGLATFIGMYLCLRRYGHFRTSLQEVSPDQQRENAR